MYSLISIILMLIGKRSGGIMLAIWQSIYFYFNYSPYVIRVVRMPFTFRHALKVKLIIVRE